MLTHSARGGGVRPPSGLAAVGRGAFIVAPHRLQRVENSEGGWPRGGQATPVRTGKTMVIARPSGGSVRTPPARAVH